ncbi:MAG: hypothetical protein HFF67_04255 [Oscillospiraceae bacterium]|nr:hypothetical protein [Oscillospiraceae bacterium]
MSKDAKYTLYFLLTVLALFLCGIWMLSHNGGGGFEWRDSMTQCTFIRQTRITLDIGALTVCGPDPIFYHVKETAGEVAGLLKDAGEISDALFFPGTPKRDDSYLLILGEGAEKEYLELTSYGLDDSGRRNTLALSDLSIYVHAGRGDSKAILFPFILLADDGGHPSYVTSGQAYTLSGSLPEGYGSVTGFLAWFYEQSPLYRVEDCSGETVVVSFLPSSLEGSLMAENQKEKVYLGTFSITTGEKTLTIDLPGQ